MLDATARPERYPNIGDSRRVAGGGYRRGMANMVTVHAQTNLPQFGLRAGEVGEVDEELAAGPLARGFAVIEGAPSKKKTAPAPDPVTDAG